MLADGSLRKTSGLLILGYKAEKQFGRRNFMELFAVFSSPTTYSVMRPSGQPLGTLQQEFVDRLVSDVSCFLLGGRAWVPTDINHKDRRIFVQPAPRGKTPTWGGYLPQFLGFTLSQKTLDVLTSDTAWPYLHPGAAEVLEARRADFRDVLTPTEGGVECSGSELRWWTFAGGRINATLRYALEAVLGDYKVTSDNHLVRLKGDADHIERDFERARDRIAEIEFWEDEQLWADVGTSLPNYRLSKFQSLVPPWIEREMVAGYLLDVAGAWSWISGTDVSTLERVPESLRRAFRATPGGTGDQDDTTIRVQPQIPTTWVDTVEGLEEACRALEGEDVVGLDTETTLHTRTLCLIQIAGTERVYLIDALAIADLGPLAPLLRSDTTTKIAHQASFETSVLGRVGLALDNVVDTLALSRRVRGRDLAGGHSLLAVCRREFGIELDKRHQISDWTRRPLSPAQIAYAAVDAEVVLRVWKALRQHEPPAA